MGKLQNIFIAGVLFAIFTLGIANFTGEITTTYALDSTNMSFVNHSLAVAQGINSNLTSLNTRTEGANAEVGQSETGNVLSGLWGILSITWSVGSFIVTPLGDFMGLVGIPAIIQQLVIGLLFGIIAWGIINAIKGGQEA